MCQRKQEWIKDCDGDYIDLSITHEVKITDKTIDIINDDHADYYYNRTDYKNNEYAFDDFLTRLKQKLEA